MRKLIFHDLCTNVPLTFENVYKNEYINFYIIFEIMYKINLINKMFHISKVIFRVLPMCLLHWKIYINKLILNR